MTGAVKVWLATAIIRGLELARASWRFLTRRHTTDPTPAPWAYIDTRPLDERDVDLEYRKVWAAEWPDDYRANWRKELT